MSDGPPRSTESPPDITNTRYQRYPETPMPANNTVDDDTSEADQDEEASQDSSSSLLTQAMTIAVGAMLIAHIWSLWTLRTDVNIIMSYQREHVQQYQHIAHLLQNMHQVKWQMIPAS